MQFLPARLHMFQPSHSTRGGWVIPGSPTTLSKLQAGKRDRQIQVSGGDTVTAAEFSLVVCALFPGR